MQLVNFRYTEAYRATLVWTEEYADKIVMSTGSIGLTLAYSLCPVHSLQLEGGYRFTGNSQTEFADTARIGGAFFGTLIYGFKF